MKNESWVKTLGEISETVQQSPGKLFHVTSASSAPTSGRASPTYLCFVRAVSSCMVSDDQSIPQVCRTRQALHAHVKQLR
jgi:hypothetical protein